MRLFYKLANSTKLIKAFNKVVIARNRIFPAASYLIVFRTDAIGDYILFRNFLQFIKQNSKFQKYKIVLVASPVCESIVNQYDSKWVDLFIPFDINDFYFNTEVGNEQRLWRLILRLNFYNAAYLMCPVLSRLQIGEAIVRKVQATFKIAPVGDCIGLDGNESLKKELNLTYDKLIPTDNELHFEFYRNKQFAEGFLQQKIDCQKPIIPVSDIIKMNKRPVVVLFPGAKEAFRQWPPGHFSKLARLIHQSYNNIGFIIAGAKQDVNIANNIAINIGVDVVNLAGTTSLPQLIELIASASLLITNDTSAFHIGAAVGTDVICLSNGNHLGRFNPYPKAVADNVVTLYPPSISELGPMNLDIISRYKFGSNERIDELKPEVVFEAVSKIMEKKRQSEGCTNDTCKS